MIIENPSQMNDELTHVCQCLRCKTTPVVSCLCLLPAPLFASAAHLLIVILCRLGRILIMSVIVPTSDCD
jgi:hypothetical protein